MKKLLGILKRVPWGVYLLVTVVVVILIGVVWLLLLRPLRGGQPKTTADLMRTLADLRQRHLAAQRKLMVEHQARLRALDEKDEAHKARLREEYVEANEAIRLKFNYELDQIATKKGDAMSVVDIAMKSGLDEVARLFDKTFK